MEVGVGGGGAREAERPQRFICGLPIAVIPGIIRQHIVHPHLHAPFGAHRHGHGDEVIVVDERVGDRSRPHLNSTSISSYRHQGISATSEFGKLDPQALGIVAGGAVVEADAGAAHRGAAAHLVAEACGKRIRVLRALTQELHPTCLAGDILREFKRAGIEPGAAVDGGASGQGAGVGQRGSDQGLGRNAVGGGASGTGCRNGESGCHAGQHRIGVRAGEDRPTRSEVQREGLAGDAIGVGGDQIKYLRARVVRRDGGAADDAGSGVECQACGQHAVGDDGKVIDRVAAGVGGGVAGAQPELIVGTVGCVDLASQVHVKDLGVIVADVEEVGAIDRDLHQLGPVAEGDGRRGDDCAVPAYLNGRGHCYGNSPCLDIGL